MKKTMRFIKNKFPQGSLSREEAIAAILKEGGYHGFLGGDIFVTMESPEWQKDEVFLRAEALKIYSNHDAPPWREEYVEGMIGILLVENGGIVGAAGFLQDKPLVTRINGKEYVSLTKQWCWGFAFIDPEHQRKGYLTKRLPKWRKRFGDFTSTRPWSEGVRQLFKKIGWFPAGEESLERNEAELIKIQLREFEKSGSLTQRWRKEENVWVRLMRKNIGKRGHHFSGYY
jgi:hypothetical protein